MNETVNQSDILAGQEVYNPIFLSLYDFLILKVSNTLVWKCPSSVLQKQFDENMTENHLDVGVGSGYFLANAKNIRSRKRIGLLDLNPSSLNKASCRLAKLGIDAEAYKEDILSRKPLTVQAFDSVSLNYLFHCLPGSIEEKFQRSIEHLKPSLHDNTVVFGSTILNGGVDHSRPAEKLIKKYNEKKIFSNLADNLEDLNKVMGSLCNEVRIHTIGSVAIFSFKVK